MGSEGLAEGLGVGDASPEADGSGLGVADPEGSPDGCPEGSPEGSPDGDPDGGAVADCWSSGTGHVTATLTMV